MSNAFGHRGFGSGSRPYSAMGGFDRLPREFRDLLNYAPANFPAEKIAVDLSRNNPVHLMRLYQDQIAQAFPGWTPI